MRAVCCRKCRSIALEPIAVCINKRAIFRMGIRIDGELIDIARDNVLCLAIGCAEVDALVIRHQRDARRSVALRRQVCHRNICRQLLPVKPCGLCSTIQRKKRLARRIPVHGEVQLLKVCNLSRRNRAAHVQRIARYIAGLAAVYRARDPRTVRDRMECAVLVRIADIDSVARGLARAVRIAAVDRLHRTARDVDRVSCRIRSVRRITDVAAVYLLERTRTRADDIHSVACRTARHALRASAREPLDRIARGDTRECHRIALRRIAAVGNAGVGLGMRVDPVINDRTITEAVHVDQNAACLARVRIRALDDFVVAADGMIFRRIVREL